MSAQQLDREELWSRAAIIALKMIRDGTLEQTAKVEGVRLLKNVTVTGRSTLYHLTPEARRRLEATGSLPWT